MAILSREDYIARVRARIGEEVSDEDITFIEDLTDTYDDMAAQAAGVGDWEAKYNELKQKYIDRFTSAADSPADIVDVADGADLDEAAEDEYIGMLSYDELFEEGV